MPPIRKDDGKGYVECCSSKVLVKMRQVFSLGWRDFTPQEMENDLVPITELAVVYWSRF